MHWKFAAPLGVPTLSGASCRIDLGPGLRSQVSVRVDVDPPGSGSTDGFAMRLSLAEYLLALVLWICAGYFLPRMPKTRFHWSFKQYCRSEGTFGPELAATHDERLESPVESITARLVPGAYQAAKAAR